MVPSPLRCLLFTAVGAAAPAQAQALPAGFGWFAELAGACWSADFPDGRTRHTQCYATQFDRFLRGSARLEVERDGARRLQFEGDSVFSWDDAAGRIVYTIWGSDGSHGRHEARYAGEELQFPVASRQEAGRIAYRSVWRRRDADSFEVRRERPDGEGWRTELTVVYRREAPEGGAAPR